MNGISCKEVFSDFLFHVHTFRCKHAGSDKDEDYIKKAIELGAKGIIFTDHSPFPGNPFGNRMDIEELPEYIATLSGLKEKYVDKIQVEIGLEVEYLPSFSEFYYELSEIKELEWLILGQHMYEHASGIYSFSDLKEYRYENEHIKICEAEIEGMKTGLFKTLAHPDRAFRRRKIWDEGMADISRAVIETACETGTILEKNVSSQKRKHQYWKEFWELAEKVSEEKGGIFWIRGLDAHSVEELESLNNMEV